MSINKKPEHQAPPEIFYNEDEAAKYTNNTRIMQIQSDMLDRPVLRPQVLETTALGAAFMAGLAAGVYGSLSDISGHWHQEHRFEAGMAADERAARMARWSRAVTRARGWMQEDDDAAQ